MSAAVQSRLDEAARESRHYEELASAHEFAFSCWVFLERVMAITATVAAAVVAIKLFVQAKEGTSEWRWAAYLSLIAAACSGFNVYLSSSKLSEKHDKARKGFRSLAAKFRDYDSTGDAEQKWAELRNTQEKVEDDAIGVGLVALSFAHRRRSSR